MPRGSQALLLLIVFMVVIMGAQSQAQTPTITGVSPASGQIGTQITITGQGLLGATSYGGVVSSLLIGGQTATTTSWTDTQIVATIPSGIPGNSTSIGISTNYNNYYNYYANSNTYTWTILQPLITAMSPTSGTPTTAVTLTGSGFGATQGTSTVTFSGAAAAVASWSDSKIIVTVPSGTASGSFLVSVPGLSPSSSSFFALTPYIGSVSPASGQIGTKITITGQGLLGSSSYNSVVSSLLIGGQAATTTSWTDTQIVATVPSGIPGNSTSIGISTNCNNYYNYYANSNTYTWTILQPLITAMSPTSGTPTTAVTLTGSGFGATQGTSTVSFSGAAAAVASWSDSKIVVTVPSGTVSGSFLVSVPGMSPSSSSFFTLTPYIASVSPASGQIGTQITITGQGLLGAASYGGVDSSLIIGGQTATTTSWTDTQIVATVRLEFRGTRLR